MSRLPKTDKRSLFLETGVAAFPMVLCDERDVSSKGC